MSCSPSNALICAGDPNENIIERLQKLENQLFKVEARLFLAELELSSSYTSNIATSHNDAYHGGAVYDMNRQTIISVSRDSNNSRDIFLTKLTDPTHGSTQKLSNIIPFSAYYRFPVYDGKDSVYFTQFTDNQNRFGYFDLKNNEFHELESLPGAHFASPFSGCFNNGIVYYLDSQDQICGYDVEKRTWLRFYITLQTHKNTQYQCVYGHLLSDPSDPQHLYYLAIKDQQSLFQIDLNTHTCILLCQLPWNSFLNNTLLIPAPFSDGFIIITCIDDGSWYMYSSKNNTWKQISKWKKAYTEYVNSYLVYSPQYNTFYYHINGCSTWEMAQISFEN